ncbi:hypothetical protein ABLAC_17360 [Acinetobacter baumannii LAC-4]|nr:hypothetical protein ABLAC_17360 [Acinetobacter baumannii LAC-4]EKL44549.1 hypothetical protein ACIN5098_1015 [Acinetobacter baumannii OIFC098]EXH96044.1 hypothetical protein J609_1327 [Acinetobacter baumannii 3390]EXQ82430.1 hypothetical protein J683_1791 [Acinetobacter baumannii 1007214]KCY37435.1 hypothetical protein J726_0713 [Acinetobacter baumannii 1262761-105]
MKTPFVSNLILMVFPYFIESNILLWGISTLLSVIPYFLRFKVISQMI